ncbi:hypothetical protein K474DRAFT_1696160 [Panus rudis PR-1116 ss-1]|nr:hypothetical protein K474DRAFT_1696160 [Panus rudis PR-1116 ss-1]
MDSPPSTPPQQARTEVYKGKGTPPARFQRIPAPSLSPRSTRAIRDIVFDRDFGVKIDSFLYRDARLLIPRPDEFVLHGLQSIKVYLQYNNEIAGSVKVTLKQYEGRVRRAVVAHELAKHIREAVCKGAIQIDPRLLSRLCMLSLDHIGGKTFRTQLRLV